MITKIVFRLILIAIVPAIVSCLYPETFYQVPNFHSPDPYKMHRRKAIYDLFFCVSPSLLDLSSENMSAMCWVGNQCLQWFAYVDATDGKVSCCLYQIIDTILSRYQGSHDTCEHTCSGLTIPFILFIAFLVIV